MSYTICPIAGADLCIHIMVETSLLPMHGDTNCCYTLFVPEQALVPLVIYSYV